MPIFDQGYQHWEGKLSGHGVRWLAVARHGVKTQLKNRYTRMLMAVAWMPALGLVAFLSLWGLLENQAESVVAFLQRQLPPDVLANPKSFRTAVWTIAYSYFFKAELLCTLFLVLIVGPNLVSRDLRFNAFPLYFSRPLRRIDYFAGKLGVIAFFLLATTVLPAVGAYGLGLAFSRDLSVVTDTHRILWGGIFYSVIVVVSAGTLMLALSSLSRRSIYVGLAWAGLVFLTHMLSNAMVAINGSQERDAAARAEITAWDRENPPPKGIEVTPYGGWRSTGPPGERDEKEVREWTNTRSMVTSNAYVRGNDVRYAQGKTDWRPVLSYTNNLERVGDALLGTDAAWVQYGKAAAAAQSMMGGGGRSKGMGGPVPVPKTTVVNERRQAERNVLQYPVGWSAATLAGLMAVSVFVMSRRVKSLDRLK